MNESWFAVTPIDGETFAISEPLHWEEPHSYLLCGESRALLIDTGLGVADMGAVVRSLTSLPVLAAVTHAHWDHIGGLGCFEHTAVHHAEASWLSGHFPLPSQAVRANLTARPCTFPHGFCPDDYRVYEGGVDHLLKDGDVIDLGNRQVRVIHTPGHSPGHCCFYEEARGLLFAGDLLYAGCLDAFYPTTDPAAFARSVRKVRQLPVQRILPGHHRLELPPDFAARVDSAWQSLAGRDLLRQGSGIFDFDGFQIHI